MLLSKNILISYLNFTQWVRKINKELVVLLQVLFEVSNTTTGKPNEKTKNEKRKENGKGTIQSSVVLWGFSILEHTILFLQCRACA